MEPFSQHTGIVVPLDRVNVDTDQIIPKQFLKRIERTGFGPALFHDWRYLNGGEGMVPNPAFVLNEPRYAGASVLLARDNFGCGSSREHAPWALMDYGFRAILAPSFADIFYTNCMQNGVLPVRLPSVTIDQLFARTADRQGYQVTVDLQAQKVVDGQGFTARFAVEPHWRDRLLRGADAVDLTLQHEAEIEAYEVSHVVRGRLSTLK